jgi:hypothetical protein
MVVRPIGCDRRIRVYAGFNRLGQLILDFLQRVIVTQRFDFFAQLIQFRLPGHFVKIRAEICRHAAQP